MAVKWIKASDIEAWTERESRRAQEILPELVGRLILASADSILDFHFPHDYAVQYAGYDGYLDTLTAGAFFPDGISVWEFGTDEDILRKFNSDYKKRSTNPGEIEKSTTWFCFVTSRVWKHHTSIVERTVLAKTESDWKCVRIFDAMSLETWLEQCPSVATWFSNIISMPIIGLISLEDYWKGVCENTDPILTADFFMQGRNSIAEKIVDLFDSGSDQIIVSSDSVVESILVMASDFLRSSNLKLKGFLERCVIVQNESVWCEISTARNSSAFFIFNFQFHNGLKLSRNKCIFPVSRSSPFNLVNKNFQRIEIERLRKIDFETAMQNLGCSPEKINVLENNSKRSFLTLLRQITKDPIMRSPAWTGYGDLRALIPVLFAGGWEINMPGDISVIEKLSAMSMGDYIKSLTDFITKEDSPLYCVENSWMCVSVPEMWNVLWGYITLDNYNRFRECMIIAFAKKDPIYELPPEQWFAGSIYGKKFDYSYSLLSGFIISLIMLTERNELNNNFSVISTSTEIDNLVHQILNNISDRQGWYTIAQYIPLFSEASPEMVLSSLEEKSRSDDGEFWSMFIPPQDTLTGRTFYTHLLLALENLTWMPEYAVRAIHVLATFSEKQFMYKSGNSPCETLNNIFSLYSPQGCLNNDNRFKLLEALVDKYPYTGRFLIEKLLSPKFSDNISKPIWKSIEIYRHIVTYKEIHDMKIKIADLFIKGITPVYNDWKMVFNCTDAFSHNIDNVIERCQEHSRQMTQEDVLKLCQQIAQYISHNRKYSAANWSMKEECLAKLEALLNYISPDSPRKYNYYFKPNFDGLNPTKYQKDVYNFENEQHNKLQLRRAAIHEMIETFGKKSVFEIIETAEDTSDLGIIIAEDILNNEFDLSFIQQVLEKNNRVASAVVLKLFRNIGFDKLIATLPKDNSPILGFVLLSLPMNSEVINYVGQSTDIVKTQYWNSVELWGFDVNKSELTTVIIKNMLLYSRPFTLIEFLAYSEFKDVETILEVLEKAVELYPNAETSGMRLDNVHNYNIERMFTKLYSEKVKYSEQIAQLELVFLFAFNYEFEPRCLVDQMLSSPELFVEFLSLVYKKDEAAGIAVTPNRNENRIHHACEVLSRIRRIPGAAGNTVNEIVFNNWIEKVKSLTRDQFYQTAFDVVVGTILAYAPIGKDGIWPCDCVRQYLNNSNSECFYNHFIFGVCNQRGVHSPTGGSEESEIAKRYFSYASELEFSFPIAAKVVRRIGSSYQDDSAREKQRERRNFYT